MKIKISNAKLIILAILTFVIETIAVFATQNLTGINRIFIIISFTLITTIALILSFILIQVLHNMIMDRKIAGEIRKYMLDYEQNGNLDKLFQNFKKIKDKPKTDYAKSLYYFNLAIAYVEDHQFQKAREVLQKSTLQKYNQSFDQIFKMLLNDIDKHEKEYNEAQKRQKINSGVSFYLILSPISENVSAWSKSWYLNPRWNHSFLSLDEPCVNFSG